MAGVPANLVASNRRRPASGGEIAMERVVPPQIDITTKPDAIVLDDLWKSYADTVAVRGVNLNVGEGEFCTILGPSGSGKTTTLMMIAGFVQPSRGRIVVAGRDITRL